MNKKLLFGIMSLAALAACTNDDFESQNVIAEQTSPIQFELINGNDASMRASWNSGKIAFSAADGDLFTLYHGGSVAGDPLALTGFENATYKATNDEGTAILTTPSMIKKGMAVMVWPADTTFLSSDFTDGKFHISIPAEQTDYVNQLPYVSDLIEIAPYANYDADKKNAYNTAGKDRKYPVFMRQMGSLLTLKADYVGNGELKKLEEGEDGIKAITVDKITLSTGAGTEFTKMIPVKFTAANGNWPDADLIHHAWKNVTAFDVEHIVDAGKTTTLSAEGESLLTGNQGANIVMLPQNAIPATGVVDAAVVVDTYYGRVVVAAPGVTVDGSTSKYDADDIKDAWIRYIKQSTAKETYEEKATSPTTSTDADQNGKYKTTSDIAKGMMQTINWFSSDERKSANETVEGEPVGGLLTRYVKVDLSKLDMSNLHVKDDKQLRDVARVWKALKLDPVTVYLDGDANNEFAISQKTIAVINEVNTGKDPADQFHVKPCKEAEHKACNTIVITEGGNVPADLTFIDRNGTQIADVAFNADDEWKWNGTVKTLGGAGYAPINSFINRGTMKNDADATLKVTNYTGGSQKFVIPFVNNGTWDITAGTLRVQFNVTNNGKVNISKGAQYRQDGQSVDAKKTTFTNEATNKPSRFGGDDSQIGKVENKGVFATIGGADINNYGLIEHADAGAKTYITANQSLAANGFTADALFTTAFDKTTSGAGNKMGRINLPFSNKEEDNISVSAALAQGFISVTVTDADAPSNGDLNASVVGNKVNYVIVNGGIQKISAVSDQVKYVEFNQPGTEIEWSIAEAGYDGLIVLSDVNIKLGTKVASKVTYLGAKAQMYVGGTFNKDATVSIGDPAVDYAATKWIGYYGNTTANVTTNYVTY